MAGHGGKRAGAGRPKLDPPARARCVYLTDDEARLVRTWGRGDLSAGLRWLIDQAKTMVVPAVIDFPRSNG